MDSGDRYRDLGGGVWDDGRPEPSEPPVTRPAGRMPSCPCCGSDGAVEPVESPVGGFYCGGVADDGGAAGCGTVFTGGDGEWRRWRQRREATAKQRTDDQAPGG